MLDGLVAIQMAKELGILMMAQRRVCVLSGRDREVQHKMFRYFAATAVADVDRQPG
jgi:hypothetical protein